MGLAHRRRARTVSDIAGYVDPVNALVDIDGDGFDLALRIGEPAASS